MKQSKKSYSLLSILLALLAGLLIVLGIFLYIRNTKRKKQEETLPEVDEADTTVPEPTDDALLNFYIETKKVVSDHYGVEDTNRAALLTAQAAFETGEFTSDLYFANNNAFGMRQPKVRDTTSLGQKGNYAHYASIADSIKDRLMWDDYNKVSYENATVKSFSQSLNKLSYFEAPYLEYQNGVNAYFKKLNSQISQG